MALWSRVAILALNCLYKTFRQFRNVWCVAAAAPPMVCLNYIAYIVTKRLVKEIYLGEENLYFSISYFEYLLNSIKSIFFAITLIGLPKSFEIIFNDNFIKAIKSENYKFIFKAKYWGIFSNCLSYFLVGITVIGYPFALLGLLKWFISRTEVKTINQ